MLSKLNEEAMQFVTECMITDPEQINLSMKHTWKTEQVWLYRKKERYREGNHFDETHNTSETSDLACHELSKPWRKGECRDQKSDHCRIH